MVVHALEVAVLWTVLKQAEAVARIFGFAVAIEVAVVLALRALDQIDQVLGVELLEGQVALVQGVLEKLRVAQQLFGLLTQADDIADFVRRGRNTDQDVPDVDQSLLGQGAGQDGIRRRLAGLGRRDARDGQAVEVAQQVYMVRRGEGERLGPPLPGASVPRNRLLLSLPDSQAA